MIGRRDPRTARARRSLGRAGLLARVGRWYYLEGGTQAGIAERLGVPRPAVARLLRLSRESGVVRITVAPPGGLLTDLEAELEERFGLRSAWVVRRPPAPSPASVRALIGRAAADDLMRIVASHPTVGLGRGELVAAMVAAIEPRRLTGARTVQPVGDEPAPTQSLDVLYLEVGSAGAALFTRPGRVAGLPVAQLRRARHVVALASGAAAPAAVVAALRSGVVHSLITDESTARAVLALATRTPHIPGTTASRGDGGDARRRTDIQPRRSLRCD